MLCASFGLVFINAAGLRAATPPPAKHTFTIGQESFLLDGKPFVIRCGEIHFPRVPREYWRHRLQMCKAMGLNAVCVYLFWNYHEWEEGKYNWSGQADAAEFCRIAQQEGLWVMLRPGPYSCAEWEMGGLPWWLLKNDNMKLRTKDPSFLAPATRYLKEVARVLGPMQITHGGPLLMVQVENEYGSFGKDAEYMGALRQALIDGGINVPLFACNPPGALLSGYRDDLFQVVNFGANATGRAFDALRKVQKKGPLLNGEYYPAWFDMWGRKHRTGGLEPIIADLDFMLKNQYSFSIYMAHGGTSFGLWSGADRPFSPDTSSYDYDAPISEAGWVTPKFQAMHDVFARYLQPGETIPKPPAANPVIAIPPFQMNEIAPVFSNLPKPIADETPRSIEFYDQSRGCTVYRTIIPAGPAGALATKEVHDFGWVFLDGKPVGVMDRRRQRYRIDLPERKAPAQLDILVEAMGRVNFGREVFDRKGLKAPVQFIAKAGAKDTAPLELKGWQVFSMPFNAAEMLALKFQPGVAGGPAFRRGTFNLTKTGDTFLDVRAWGKGVVWVNGRCLGRFWNIGPTQTMYCPGPWLRVGANQVIVLDLLGPQQTGVPVLAGLDRPILNEIRSELDFARRVRATGTFTVPGSALAQGSFTGEVQWQEARFTTAAQGRYLCLEALNSLDDKPLAAVAEFDALDEKGEAVSKTGWKILWVDGEEIKAEAGDAENVLDGQPASCWLTPREPITTPYPHRIVIDLGQSQSINGIRYLPRAGDAKQTGRIKDYRVYLSEQPFSLLAPR